MTPRPDTPKKRHPTDKQAAFIARLRDKGLGLAPLVEGGRIVRPKREIKSNPQCGAVGAPVADLSPVGPATRSGPVRPAERHTALLPDPEPLQLAGTFEIDMTRFADWQASRISANDRLTHHPKAKRTKRWRLAGKLAAKGWNAGPVEYCRVVAWYRFPDDRRRESANLQPTTKAIVDGLVDAGVMVDDDDSRAYGQDNRRLYPNGPHKVVVQVWTVAA